MIEEQSDLFPGTDSHRPKRRAKIASINEASEFFRGMNPWWGGNPGRPLPKIRRWAFETILRRLDLGLAPAVVLRGPRQVGKTTLHEQIIDYLIKNRGIAPRRIFRAQFDELLDKFPAFGKRSAMPVLSAAEWFEKNVLQKTFNHAAHDNENAFLFLDEVQNVDSWSQEIKHLVDIHSVKVVVTGSSALRIRRGKDSSAGRLTTIDIGTLHLAEIAKFRGIKLDAVLPDNNVRRLQDIAFWRELRAYGKSRAKQRDAAFTHFAQFGGYPLAHIRDASWEEVAEQLNETVIRRVIEHDLRSSQFGGHKRDRALLETVFRIACRYCGQHPNVRQIAEQACEEMKTNVGEQRIRHYLEFLDDALLLRRINPQEMLLKKRKGADKICIIDHALRASWLSEAVDIDPPRSNPANAVVAGHIVESVVGAYLAGIPGVSVSLCYFPERDKEPEVDFVLTVGDIRIPIEVKYRSRIRKNDETGLRAYIEKDAYRASFGLLITPDDSFESSDPRIVALPLSSLLLLR